jgi:hypothetical protein
MSTTTQKIKPKKTARVITGRWLNQRTIAEGGGGAEPGGGGAL